jgi:predicted SAM-dependent methyltransferase
MFDIIEHLAAPELLLREVHRILRAGGLVVLQVPNRRVSSIWSTLEWRSLAWREEHCSLQPRRSLAPLLRESGFDELVIER